jgi:long-chain acyl-CoA synthetase
LLNRIHDSIWAKAAEAGGVKAALFKQAFSAKQWWLKQNHLSHAVWDPLVFRPIAHHVGLDRCRLLLSASAPLSSHVLEFLRIVFSCQVVEGYGQTECGGACSVTRPEDQASLGHVGPPLACNEIKLVSLPDLGYSVTDTIHGEERDPASGEVKHPGVPCQGRGEIWVRGPNVFSAYYKDVDNTASTITPDGWMKSGDIGMWDARGRLCIIDRKKNMFKLSQGEYVAAEKVENECLTDWVQQIFVYGDSFHSMLVAIVVPNHDTLRHWAATHGKGSASPAELLKDPELKASILKDMQTQGRARGLQGFEVPRDIYLEPNPWTPDDLLTPTFKLKRADAKKQYQEQIDALYGGLESVAGRKGMRQGKAG